MPAKSGLLPETVLFLIVLGGAVPARGEASLETADSRQSVEALWVRQDSLSTAYDSLHAKFYACGSPEMRKRCVAQMAEVVHQIKSVRQAWQTIQGPYLGPSFAVWDSMWADPYPAIEESLRIPGEQFRRCKIRRQVEMREAGYAVRTSVLACKGIRVTITAVRAVDGSFAAADTAYVAVSGEPEIILSSPEGKPRVSCIYGETAFGREFYVIFEQEGRGFRIVSKGFSYGVD